MNTTDVTKARWERLRAALRADLPALTVAPRRDFLGDYPECGPAWKILGSALIDVARYEEAEHVLKRAVSFCPPEKLWIPLAELGHLYRARGEFKAAIAWYRQAVEAVPDEAGGYIFLGGLLARWGRPEAGRPSRGQPMQSGVSRRGVPQPRARPSGPGTLRGSRDLLRGSPDDRPEVHRGQEGAVGYARYPADDEGQADHTGLARRLKPARLSYRNCHGRQARGSAHAEGGTDP